ncbi:MAG: radical SAM family heme chaperone HemW, partial [Aestuariivirga sp.]
KAWVMASDAEITLEANPTSVEAENFRGYRAAGINRVSVGVQALNDADLQALGRNHSAAEAIAAFRLAAKIFPRVSFDLIYARPRQTVAEWRRELSEALSHQQGHMSLYQLTIEPGTAFAELQARGALAVPPEDRAADLYDVTQELTEQAGLPAYEVSNHALAGHESRHNLLYWRYGEYAGVGPGAHSRLGDGASRRALIAEKHPETWCQLVTARGTGVIEDAGVANSDQATEYLLMGLRVTEGIDAARYEALAGRPIDSRKIAGLESTGLVSYEGLRLRATPAGRRVLNALIAELAL